MDSWKALVYVLEPVPERKPVPQGMAHKDLNEDWFWMMDKNNPQDYANNITGSDPGGYQHCGDPLARQVVTETYYFSSFTSDNKEENK